MVEFCFEAGNWSPYFGYEGADLDDMIRIAAENGYRWISFDLPMIDRFRAQGGAIETLRGSLAVRGVRMLAVHSLSIDADIKSVETLCRSALRTCKELGARYLHAGVIAPIDAQVVEATRRAGRLCREAGVGLAMEFLPFLPLASIGQTRDLLRAADVTGPGIVVDTWHFFNGPDDWAELKGLSSGEIAYVQFNDHGPLGSDDLFRETVDLRVMPGKGIFDLTRFAAEIRQLGYDGIVGIEVLSTETRRQPVEDVARQMMKTSAPYWGSARS